MLVEIFLDSMENDSRVPDRRMDVVVIRASEQIEFGSGENYQFIGRDVRDGIFTVE